jgi:hypothetical protein
MRSFRGHLAVGALLALGCVGCVDYHWMNDVERAEQKAKAEGKYLFVFYKWWLVNDSARLETEVLQDERVARLFQDTVNCRIVYEYPPNRDYMAAHGIHRAPGLILQAPDGTYHTREGYVPEDALIKWASAILKTQEPVAASKRPPPPPKPSRNAP